MLVFRRRLLPRTSLPIPARPVELRRQPLRAIGKIDHEFVNVVIRLRGVTDHANRTSLAPLRIPLGSPVPYLYGNLIDYVFWHVGSKLRLAEPGSFTPRMLRLDANACPELRY